MIHHGGSDKLYMSEEMIGAYLEGKLAPHDARYVESLMERDADIASLVNDCKGYDEMFHQYGYRDGLSFTGAEDSIPGIDDSFTLPEIPDDVIIEQLELSSDLNRKFDTILLGEGFISFDCPLLDSEEPFLND